MGGIEDMCGMCYMALVIPSFIQHHVILWDWRMGMGVGPSAKSTTCKCGWMEDGDGFEGVKIRGGK
jgi:hypothetical protein